jgi:hypothetical protein
MNNRIQAVRDALNIEHYDMAQSILEDMYEKREISLEQFKKEASALPDFLKMKLPKPSLKFTPIKMIKVGLHNMSPREFILERFDMERKNVILLCGGSNAGKTIFAQYLALAVANNLPLFGKFSINNPEKAKRVLHIDYEQSEIQTQRRYERLAVSLGLSSFCIDRIKLPYKLDDMTIAKDEMKAALIELMNGYDMVMVDSLRQSMQCDENSSQVSYVLELLKSLAEVTNTVMLLIHHKGKNPNSNNKDQGRGSSAIYAGVDIVIDLDADEEGNITLKCQKNRDQIYFSSLIYRMQDGGQKVENQRCTEMLQLMLVDGEVRKDNRIETILNFVTNGQEINYTDLYDQAGKGDKGKFKALIADMVQQKLLMEKQLGKARMFSMAENGLAYLAYEVKYETD